MGAEQVRDAYASVAELYISLFGTSAQVHTDDLDLIGRHLTTRPGRILDLGCGPGHLTAYLRSRGADAAGVDLVPEFLDHARSTHPTVPYRLGSLKDLDAEPGPIGGILAWYSLIHLPPADLDGVLAGFHRALTPGGALVAGFFPGAEVAPFPHKVTTAYFWPPDEFAERLDRAGFDEVERQHRPADGTVRAHAAIAARSRPTP